MSNVVPAGVATVEDVYNLIRCGRYRERTERLRALTDAKERRALKARSLDYVTFSGVFGYRMATSIREHSGLICLDFDHVRNMERLWEGLKGEDGLRLMFHSPSGDGIKAVFAVEGVRNAEEHLAAFVRLRTYVMVRYGVEADGSGKDVCRACFLCFDPCAYLRSGASGGSIEH